MSATNSASTRICPVCEAQNSNLSLFCAECGSSLNVPESDDTADYVPVTNSGDDAQRTATFEPGSFTSSPPPPAPADDAPTGPPRRPAPSSDLPHAAAGEPPANGYQATWNPFDAPEPAPVPGWNQPEVRFEPSQEPLGIRGFMLGVVAVLLILAVFLVWTWATLLDQDTRDSIQDFFGFLG